MTPQILLDECRAAGVLVQLHGDRIRFRGPANEVAMAAERLRPHKSEVVNYLLKQFRFEQSEKSSFEMDRLNNMAWEFMQADGLSFTDAIKLSAEIVTHCKAAACEAAYVDVRELWKRLSKSATTC